MSEGTGSPVRDSSPLPVFLITSEKGHARHVTNLHSCPRASSLRTFSKPRSERLVQYEAEVELGLEAATFASCLGTHYYHTCGLCVPTEVTRCCRAVPYPEDSSTQNAARSKYHRAVWLLVFPHVREFALFHIWTQDDVPT